MAMNITNLRRLRGLTQIDLADMAAITQPTVSRAEKGDDGSTLGVYRGIAAALDVRLADLFADDRTMAETELLRAFQQMPADRQRGWLDMARMVIADLPPKDREIA